MSPEAIVDRVLSLFAARSGKWVGIRRRGRLLLVLPPGKQAAIRGLELYQPQRATARAGVAGLRIACALGFHRLLPAVTRSDGIVNTLVPPLPATDPSSIAILLGSREHKVQRAIASYQTATGWEVAKISFGPAGEAILRREADVLSHLHNNVRGVPRLLGLHHGEGVTVLRMPYFSGSRIAMGESKEALGFLNEWVKPQAGKPIREFPEWISIQAALPGFKAGSLALERLKSECLNPVIRHGDFTRWNLLRHNEENTTVIDWEWAHSEGMPGIDLVHYLLQDARLVQRRCPYAAIRSTVDRLKSPACRDYLAKTGWKGDPVLPVIACLAFKQGARHQENREYLAAALEIFAHSMMGVHQTSGHTLASLRISVITPNYRQLDKLKLCAASVADQQGSFQHEHIIEDGGSGVEFDKWASEQSFAVCKSQPDNGMYDAINRGFRKATGDIVAWLNSDEQYLPGTLEKVRRYFDGNPDVDIAFGDVVLVDESGEPLAYRQTILPTLGHIRTCHLSTFSAATFVRASVLEAGIFLDERWKVIADAVWVENILSAGFKAGLIGEPLAAFTMLGSNLGQSHQLYEERQAWEAELADQQGSKNASVERFKHRLKKMAAGSYANRTLSMSLYTSEGSPRRSFKSTVGGRWEKAKERAGKMRDNRDGMVAHYQMNRTWPNLVVGSVVIALIIAAVIMDVNITAAVISPFWFSASMMLLSFRCRPSQMVVMAIIFAVVVTWALLGMQYFTPERLAVRLMTFIVTSILAVLWTAGRANIAEWTMSTVAFIRKMPNPFILVDSLGQIIMVNAYCQKEYGIQEQKLLLEPIESFIPDSVPKFASWGQRPPQGYFRLLIPSENGIGYRGEIFCVGRGKKQLFGISMSLLPTGCEPEQEQQTSNT